MEGPETTRIDFRLPMNRGKADTEGEPVTEHHSVYCPNCSERLTGHRCKLVCRKCGYYLSCADYY